MQNTDTHGTFHYKYCEYCGVPIPRNSEVTCCDNCRERILFYDVKDFIRANDVNEFQVADYFNIPLRMVKKWIIEGRIEYKEMPNGQRTLNNHLRCERCGSTISFGTLCTKCLKDLNKNMHGYAVVKRSDDDKMRYLDLNGHNNSPK